MARQTQHRRIVPEVVQTSAMDCGPASLKAILDGFGIPASYGRLREACQTEIDGTSIDTMESIAQSLGLDAEQVMVPADHLLIDEAELLPALVVVRLPTGGTHFVVAWSRHGPWVQVMDPATGRRWQTRSAFLRDLYIHSFQVPASDWLDWASSEEFLAPMCARLRALGLPEARALAMTEEARSSDGWLPLAALDAATRLVASLRRSGAVKRSREASEMLLHTFSRALKSQQEGDGAVPAGFWSVRAGGADDDGEEILYLSGAVLVRIRGFSSEAERDSAVEPEDLPEDLKAALDEQPQRPVRDLIRLIRQDGLLPPVAALTGLAVSAITVLMETLLYRGMLDLGRFLGFAEQRLMAVLAFTAMLVGLMLLVLPNMANVFRLGRHLDARLRVAFLEKIPRLGDRYFHSRLSSDMAERAHAVHNVRGLPALVGQLWRSLTMLVAITAGIIWLDPRSAPIAVLAAAISLFLPLFSQRFLIERDLRVRTHVGALSRFFLDSLLGLTALRCHSAERAVEREHEMLLTEWARASFGLLRIAVTVEGLVALSGYALAVLLLTDHLARTGESGMVLLLIFWLISLPTVGQEVARTAREIPRQRNIILRLLEPLGAPDETDISSATTRPPETADDGVDLRFEGVSVQAGGHTILSDIDLHVPAGSHVAIVGRSGAGKSSLVGLLLGWHRPTTGSLKVNGVELEGAVLEELRRQTAWIDPAVRLWNRPLINNLLYGNEGEPAQPLTDTLEQARLYGVLERLPDGLQTVLGEGGGLVSGGEGQRVRLARALNRNDVRLALLDEPFRGLDRVQRRLLLEAARRRWAETTLLCVTHDIRETVAFDRVIVVDSGQIVEDGLTAELRKSPDSHYSRLLAADEHVHLKLWMDPEWRRLNLSDGVLDGDGDAAP